MILFSCKHDWKIYMQTVGQELSTQQFVFDGVEEQDRVQVDGPLVDVTTTLFMCKKCGAFNKQKMLGKKV